MAAARAQKLTDMVERARARGLRVLMLTLTVRHGPLDDAIAMFKGVGKAWSRLIAGQWWVDLASRWRIEGWTRGVEVTHGKNGWHPHIHALVLVGADVDVCVRDRVMVSERWRRIVKRVLGPAFEPDDVHGVDIRECDAETYIAKMAFYVTGASTSKAPAEGHRTPWDIARAVVDYGDPADIALWREWQRATYGRKQLTWSRGAKAILDDDPEAAEERAVDEQTEARDELVIAFHNALDWRLLAPAMALLLDVIEAGGGAEAVLSVARDVVREALRAGDEIARWLVLRDSTSAFYGLDTS
jgi:hypothetical protein